MRSRCCVLGLLVCVLLGGGADTGAEEWQAGAAKIAITPAQPMWMSGYASRNRPAEGKIHDLWAKALVLEDPHARRVVLVTLDLVGIDRDFALAVRGELAEKYGLALEQTALLSSHTHSGPVAGETLISMYFLDDQQLKLVQEYTAALRDGIVQVVGEAIEMLEPANIAWGQGHADFAVNRRNNREPDVPSLRAEGKLLGPHDHDVPVLAVRSPEGKLRAVLFGYACHATVLDGYDWCGDYPGFAQIDLEREHPGAIALFFAGCGADQNPIPRRRPELAAQYGRELAEGVNAVLTAPMQAIAGELTTAYREIDLSFAQLPDREQLLAAANSDNRYEASRARLLLGRIESEAKLDPTYPYPIAVWRLGDGPRLVMLGGEVVVDYALRIKQQAGERPVWIAGYANDVMAYIPSRRVLEEGGYEGGGAMVYYGLPAPWAATVEEQIVDEVAQQSKRSSD